MEGFKKGAQVGAGVEAHGKAMGFKKGGYVEGKNTSGEFVMKTEKQSTMDHGTQPPRKGRNQQEIEAGGTKRMTPGYKEGGYVKCKHGGRTAYKKGGKYYTMDHGGRMKPYRHGGAVHAGASGAKNDYPGRNRVGMNPNRSQGEEKQPAQRGAKHVGKGGKTGMHKRGRISDSSGSKSQQH